MTVWSDGTCDCTASAVGSSDAHVSTALASAWPRIVTSSGIERRVFVGTATAPALCTAA